MKENGKGATRRGRRRKRRGKTRRRRRMVVVGVSKAGQRAAHRHLLSFITVPVRPPKTESLLSSLDSYHGPTHGNIMKLLIP